MRCHYCGSHKNLTGYGFAAGLTVGGYTHCGARRCGKLLEFSPDLDVVDAMTPDEQAHVKAKVAELEKTRQLTFAVLELKARRRAWVRS